MKKYKLLKWFPTLPKDWEVGMELGVGGENCYGNYFPYHSKYSDYYVAPNIVENNPEFFEEIIKKEYEILELYTTNHNNHYFLREDGGYSFKGAEYGNSFKTCQKYGWQIFSIKRLSDGEVFTLGDELIDSLNKGHGKFTLKEIEFESAPAYKGTGKLPFVHTHPILGKWIPLERLEKAKTPIFVTEDCVEIFEGDDYITLDPEDYSFVWSVADQESLKSNWLKFAKRESAEDYVLWNAPLLSLKDVASIYPGINKEHNSPSHQAELIKALVKSRL